MSGTEKALETMATVLHIYHVSMTRLRVQLAGVTELVFELALSGEFDYDQVIADICAVAPAMMRYDASLMAAYDGPTKAHLMLGDRRQIEAFVQRYQTQFTNISVVFLPIGTIAQGGAE